MSTPSGSKAAMKALLSSCRPRSRAEAKEASREALVMAAMALFSEKGLDVSLDEVCKRAGYTRGAFYVHFKDRDDMMAAVMERVGHGALDAFLGGVQTESLETTVGRFVAALAAGEHPVSRKGGVRPYQLLDACARSETERRGYQALVEAAQVRLAEALRRNQEAGLVRADIDPRGAAALMEALVIGLETMHDVEAPVDLAACAATLMTLLQPKG